MLFRMAAAQLGTLTGQNSIAVEAPAELLPRLDGPDGEGSALRDVVRQQTLQPAEEMAFEQPSTGEYYVVAVGRRRSIFLTWNEARPLVSGYPHNQHQKFQNLANAERFLLRMLQSDLIYEEHKIALCRTMEGMPLQYMQLP